MKITSEFRTYEGVYLEIGRYLADGSLSIAAWNKKEGSIASLTVCLVNPFLKENEAYVDINNCPWVLDFIHKYQLGEESGHTAKSGFCTYPAVEFDLEKIKLYQEE